jgi:hypothetical protein
MTGQQTISIDEASARIDRMLGLPDETLAASARERADELLALGEAVLEAWLIAHGATPTEGKVEGFRVLALHRQGARGDPSFNACRETCRELVYHHNLVRLDPAHSKTADRIRLGAMVTRHLALFIGGKLQVIGLGEFCCSSRPLRQREGSRYPGATS